MSVTPLSRRQPVRVVVRSSGRQVEAEVSLDWTVAQIVPELLQAVFGAQDAHAASRLAWAVSLPGGDLLDGASTLADLDLVDGSVLVLEPAGQWRPAPGRPPAVGGDLRAGRAELPRQRAQAVLPAREGLVQRSAEAISAMFAGSRPAPAPARVPITHGGRVPPTLLMKPGRGSALQQARESWRGTDYLRRLDLAVQSPQLLRCPTVAVMSPKGGVGKTTVCALLGTLFALLRRDRVVAVDANPDFGSLGRGLAPGHGVFLDDLLEVLDSPELTVAELDAHLGRSAHGLMVLPSPPQPARMSLLDEAAYTRVIDRLQAMVGMLLLDCGTGLHDAGARAALATADQVLLVTDPSPGAARLVAEAATLLYQRRLPAWLVVNKLKPGERDQLSGLEALAPRVQGMLSLPFDERTADQVAAGALDWRLAPRRLRIRGRELAAALVAGWLDLGLAA
jgi:MinD-like ATPase involved in chromosome partitioning or flagellar assembly